MDKDLREMLIRPDAPAPRKVAVRVWPRAIPQVSACLHACLGAGRCCRARGWAGGSAVVRLLFAAHELRASRHLRHAGSVSSCPQHTA